MFVALTKYGEEERQVLGFLKVEPQMRGTRHCRLRMNCGVDMAAWLYQSGKGEKFAVIL